MENASKALLIAAAVLIAIVLVALGVRLLNGVGDTSDSADKTGEAISDSIHGVADSIMNDLLDVTSMDDNSFNDYIKTNYNGVKTGQQVLQLCGLIKTKYGSVHKNHDVLHLTCSNSYEINSSNVYTMVKNDKKYEVSFSGKSMYIEEK